MRISDFGRYALGFFAVLAVLTGCGGSQTQPTPSAMTGQTQSFEPSRHEGATAVQACFAGRYGTAHCDALVRTDVKPNGQPAGYRPADLQAAYNLPSSSKGAGQIVALVDAYDNPNVASDLAVYRSTFGLPTANFTKYNQAGQQGDFPTADSAWGVQIDLDAEMVSASCPNCTIYLVEANSSSTSDLEKAAAESVKLGAHIVNNAYSGTGFNQKYYDAKGVIYLAAAGYDLGEPAAFGSVAAVGATSLVKGGGGKRGWTESALGGSGGCTNEPKPRWQHDRSCAYRLTNDVSAVGDPSTGVAEYDSYGYGGWLVVGGTSVSTPLIAGVFGLAGNATAQDGGRTFWQKAHAKYLYRIQSGGKYVRYSTAGGWGTPDGTGAF